MNSSPSAVRPRSLPVMRAWGVLGALACGVTPAYGRPPDEPTPDKSAFTLVNPTPRSLMREMSTDRPDTTESPFSVDAGHLQIEVSLVDFTLDDAADDEPRTTTWGVAPLLAKIGLLNNVEVQLGLDPYTYARSTDGVSGPVQHAEGFGDTVVRVKVNLWGNDPVEGQATAFALMPFVKIPTADRSLGNGHVEGGIILPLAVALAEGWSLGAMAEIDLGRSERDHRPAVDFVHTLTIGHDLTEEIGAYIEYAGFTSLTQDEPYRAYFDAGLTFGLTPDLQVDLGVRAGLTEASEDLGLFVGISLRY